MTTRTVKIRTKNFTADELRKSIKTDSKVVVRLGSTTPTDRIFRDPRNVLEINTPGAVQNSRDKLRMKACFTKGEIPQAEYWTFDKTIDVPNLPYPVVVKRICGFQGRGMLLIKDYREFNRWYNNVILTETGGWFIEKFYDYSREYRLHVAKGIGIIMSWRKLRTNDATERWFFNSHNCVWAPPEHDLFDKPSCWKLMEKAALDCLKVTGLDIGAVDIRVQSSKKKNPKFIVCEINSAPSLGEEGLNVYRDTIKKLITIKQNEQSNL